MPSRSFRFILPMMSIPQTEKGYEEVNVKRNEGGWCFKFAHT